MKRKSRKATGTKGKRSASSARAEPLTELKRAVKRVVGRAAERARAGEETATKLLTKQHDEVRALFKTIEAARSRSAKLEAFDEVAAKLAAHDTIEREIFYPACERAMGMNQLLGEALVEHGLVEFSLFQTDEARRRDDFDYKVRVLSEVVAHHVREEEDSFFPRVEKALGKETLLELGERMKARFEEAVEADFRAPLRKNLNQVLAGVIKPRERSSRKSGARSHAASGPKSTRRRRAA
ncbi:MAG: hemerythrin domain-containing protein [Myxococcota bacterium]